MAHGCFVPIVAAAQENPPAHLPRSYRPRRGSRRNVACVSGCKHNFYRGAYNCIYSFPTNIASPPTYAMDPLSAASASASGPSTQRSSPPHGNSDTAHSHMSTKATASCFVALLAVVLTVVWRRRQRWRRTRPWLAKLRAEAASKIEKERANTAEGPHRQLSPSKEPAREEALNEKDRSKGKEKPGVSLAEVRSDSSVSGKRSKERRKRGKEAKPATRMSVMSKADVEPQAPVSSDSTPTAQPSVPEPRLERSTEDVAPQASTSHISRPSSPRLIPLPPSPLVDSTPLKPAPPALVLSGPESPLSTSLSISATELTVTTPTTSTSVSPAPASPAFVFGLKNNNDMPSPSPATRSKLPAFPPASPLPPSLARKQPPLARRSTPSITSLNRKGSYTVERKDSFTAERKGSKDSEGVVEVEFPTLSPWPVSGKRDDDHSNGGKRRGGDRKSSDVGRKDGDTNGRGRKPSEARKKAGANGAGPTPESTQIASLKGALEAARLREEEVSEERKTWQKRERDLQTQVNQLAHQLHAMSIAFATGGMQGYPPYGYGHGGAVAPERAVATPEGQPTLTAGTPSVEHAPSPGDQSHTPTSAPLPTPTSSQDAPVPPPAGQVPSTPIHGPVPPQPAYPPMYFPAPFHPQLSLFIPAPHGSPMPHGPPTMPPPHGAPMIPVPSPMMSPPQQHAQAHGTMSPPQASPYLISPHPWSMPMMHGAGSPMHMSAPSPGGYATPASGYMNPGGMMHPIPGRHHARAGFFSGSPRRSRSPYIHHRDARRRQGTPSTPSVGSVDDGLASGLGSWPGRPGEENVFMSLGIGSGSLKREREPETDEAGSSSEEDEEEEDSDDDSVIFEDGSVSDSVNLSLRGESFKEPAVLPVKIAIASE